jgi:hypothetical protein
MMMIEKKKEIAKTRDEQIQFEYIILILNTRN